jgi:hypothetical protein
MKQEKPIIFKTIDEFLFFVRKNGVELKAPELCCAMEDVLIDNNMTMEAFVDELIKRGYTNFDEPDDTDLVTYQKAFYDLFKIDLADIIKSIANKK